MLQLNCSVAPDEADTPPSADRRVAIRYALGRSGTCRLALGNPARAIPARWADISTGGVGLIVEHPFAPGSLLLVELDGEPKGPMRQRLARVQHVTPWGRKRWWLGCKLSSALTEDELLALLQSGVTRGSTSTITRN